ncbi:MAG TPA: membrane protein insertase YidC [Candidatus Babeliales bacterium]|nr:membrane protein insertase YidC [Candidatus Babeliales bacterium]
MNVKELLVVVLLALITTWGIDYLLYKRGTNQEAEVKSGQQFVAPKVVQEAKPLNVEVDFIDIKRPAPAVVTEIETDYARMVFSTDAASLERLEFKPTVEGIQREMTTIFPVAETDRDKRCFLVALQETTPYYYTLVSNRDLGNTIELVYRAECAQGVINKTFTIYKQLYKINLLLSLEPKAGNAMQPRVFFPAPILPSLKDDIRSGIFNDSKGSITIIPRAKMEEDSYWYAPTLFGADDRYFVHALVDSGSSTSGETAFVQRAYYKLTGQQDIQAILEGPTVDRNSSWNMAFYFGPKEEQAMVAVDPRLIDTLGYAGWFAPIAKWLLKLLNFLYDYVGNYGWAIIILTILTKLVLLPFSIKSAQGMKKHAELQRKLKYLEQKYKDNAEMLAREKAELMRKEGLTSMAGCLPLFLQLPVFFALSRVLSTSIELYEAPFILWIKDLSATDPYYILPLLVAATMLAQATTVEASQRMQMVVMALVFGAITANLSAGLCLYIFMSTLLGIIQTVVQQKMKVV